MSLQHHAKLNDVVQFKQLLADGVDINVLDHRHRSALFIASERGHNEIVKILLQEDAAVSLGSDPLIAAARNGHESCVRLLLKYGASLQNVDDEGHSAMLAACKNKHYSIVELLMDNGATPIDDDSWVLSLGSQHASLTKKLLDYGLPREQCSRSSFFRHLLSAFKTGMKDSVVRMLSSGLPSTDDHYSFALFYSAKHNWRDLLVTLLTEGMNVNSTSAYQHFQTALYCACEQEHKDVVDLLLQYGANPNVCNQSKLDHYFYPLQIAAVKGNVDIVHFLLDHGALLDNTNAATARGNSKTETPWHLAYNNGHMEVVELLASRGNIINKTDIDGKTLLHKAAKSCCIDDVRRILALGANVNLLNRKKESPVHLALSHKGSISDKSEELQTAAGRATLDSMKYETQIAEVVGVLLQHGAACNIVCSKGESPLYRACENRLLSLVKLLLAAGSMLEVPWSTKQPVQHACETGEIEILAHLLDAGADVNAGTLCRNNRSVRAALPFPIYHRMKMHCSTPLSTAVKHCKESIVEMLLQYGADVRVRDDFNKDAVDYAIDEIVKAKSLAQYSQYEAVIHILLKAGAQIGRNMQISFHKNPLYRMCVWGFSEVVECLLHCRSLLKRGNYYVYCSLAVACENNNVGILQQLLAHKSKLPSKTTTQWFKLSAASKKGYLLLQIAAANGNAEITDILLNCGANVNQTNARGETALHVASNVSVAELLLNRSADPNKSNYSGTKPLGMAAHSLNHSVVELLVKHGANVNASNFQGNSALHEALTAETYAHETPLRTVTVLLDLGASVNEMNKMRKTPLYEACCHQDEGYQLVKLLLLKGADPNLGMIGSESEMLKIAENYNENNLIYPLTRAVCRHNVEVVRLLLEHGAQPNNRETYSTVLHLAVDSIQLSKHCKFIYDCSIVELLLKYGATASINSANTTGETPLYQACSRSIVQLVLIFLKHGADTNPTLASIASKNPLVAACKNDNVEIVRLLLANGAKATVLSNRACGDYYVPICAAASKQNFSSMTVLIEHGADVNQKDFNGKTALHLIAASNCKNTERCLDLLLDNNADVTILCDDGESPLYVACSNGVLKTVEKLIRKDPRRLTHNKHAKHPLVAACRYKRLDVVDCLLYKGFKLEEDSYVGCESLFWAVEHEDVEIVECLLDAGISVNCIDHKKNSLLHSLFDRLFPMNGLGIGIEIGTNASAKAKPRAMFNLLLEYGADVNMPNNAGKSVLSKATDYRLSHIVGELLKHGGNPNFIYGGRSSLLSIACSNLDNQIAAILIAAGANLDLLHPTPLISAVKQLDTNLLVLLMENGVQLDVKNDSRSTKCATYTSTTNMLNQFFVPSSDIDVVIMRLFKAGSTLSLLSMCCDLYVERYKKEKDYRDRLSNSSLSGRLCQAVVLAGYRVQYGDLEELKTSSHSHCLRLASWLEEDMKSVPSLMRQCRTVVRQQLSAASGCRTILPLVDRLPIPDQLRMYLNFEGLFAEVDLTLPDEDCDECIWEEEEDGSDDDYFGYDDYDAQDQFSFGSEDYISDGDFYCSACFGCDYNSDYY